MAIRSVFCALAGAGLLALSGPVGGQEINWGTSYHEGKKLAKESGRLMIIDFTADW